jgi:hypothetical protein
MRGKSLHLPLGYAQRVDQHHVATRRLQIRYELLAPHEAYSLDSQFAREGDHTAPDARVSGILDDPIAALWIRELV